MRHHFGLHHDFKHMWLDTTKSYIVGSKNRTMYSTELFACRALTNHHTPGVCVCVCVCVLVTMETLWEC